MANVITYKQIKTDGCDYDSVSLGEVMLRVDPRDVPTARARDNLRVFQGGGETNIACGLAHTFGLRSAVLTALVDDPVGENIRNQLREAGVDVSNILWWNTRADGSPYSTDAKGSLHNGINFTYVGAGALPSHTTYYRAHSAAAQMKPGDFDFDALFGGRGRPRLQHGRHPDADRRPHRRFSRRSGAESGGTWRLRLRRSELPL